MNKNTKETFKPGTRVEVLFDELTLSWLTGTTLGFTKTGVVVKLNLGGLVVTRRPEHVLLLD
jgi:hypothetical protein